MTFLFWNMKGRPLQERVGRIVRGNDVDMVMLAECDVEVGAISEALAPDDYRYHESEGDKVKLFSRLPGDAVREVALNLYGDTSIRRITLGSSKGFLLALVHYPSRLHWTPEDQNIEARNLYDDIARAEDEYGARRTILVGDLNMNPFDVGLIAAGTLHAVMTKEDARREERTVRGREYRLFYNPMWGCFGDRTSGPPGTFYRGAAVPINYFWNIYDQVLLRPSLMDGLQDLRILDHDGHDTLVTDAGRPRKDAVSDHLPLLFRLDLQP